MLAEVECRLGASVIRRKTIKNQFCRHSVGLPETENLAGMTSGEEEREGVGKDSAVDWQLSQNKAGMG